jgi:hypothetical protein
MTGPKPSEGCATAAASNIEVSILYITFPYPTMSLITIQRLPYLGPLLAGRRYGFDLPFNIPGEFHLIT